MAYGTSFGIVSCGRQSVYVQISTFIRIPGVATVGAVAAVKHFWDDERLDGLHGRNLGVRHGSGGSQGGDAMAAKVLDSINDIIRVMSCSV